MLALGNRTGTELLGSAAPCCRRRDVTRSSQPDTSGCCAARQAIGMPTAGIRRAARLQGRLAAMQPDPLECVARGVGAAQ
jgi:hypothetical protein